MNSKAEDGVSALGWTGVISLVLGALAYEGFIAGRRKLLQEGIVVLGTVVRQDELGYGDSMGTVRYRYFHPSGGREVVEDAFVSREICEACWVDREIVLLSPPQGAGDPVPYFALKEVEIEGAARELARRV